MGKAEEGMGHEGRGGGMLKRVVTCEVLGFV